MDLRQLQTLLAVVDHGGFTAAADALHTVQSNVSSHVARLERELGAELVDRRTGAATAEGLVVVERARRIQSEFDAITADVSSLRDEITGAARIGLIGTTARWLVPPLVEEMARRHPRVTLEVIDATTASLLLQLTSTAIDLAVITLPIDDRGVHTELLFTEERVLACPSDDPLAHIAHPTLADLDGVPLIVEPRGRPFRDLLEARFAAEGLRLAIRAEVDGTRLVASLAFEGFGAALLPASAVSNRPDLGWHVAPFDGLPHRSVGVATRRQGLLSAPALALAAVLRDVVDEQALHQPGVHPHHDSPPRTD